MKRKFSRILGVGLTFVLLASLMVFAAPASAGTLVWYYTSPRLQDAENVLVAGIDVVDLAVSDETVYAATADSTSPLFKSTNTGVTWADLSTTTDFPIGKAVKLVAVAADDEDCVAIVTTENKVYYSDDGGDSWSDPLGLQTVQSGAVVNDIDLSVAVEGDHYIAVGGTDSSDAELYTIKLAMAESFTARTGHTNAAGNFTASQDEILAVKFSTNFDIDKTITCISADDSANEAYFQVFRCEEDAYTWNGGISFFNASDWNNGILIDSGEITAMVGGVATASIAMDTDYDGTEEGTRVAFAGVAGVTSGGGVVRLSDAYVKEFTTWSAGTEGQINSIAYSEAGKLLAGSYDENKVYRCTEPMASEPRFERLSTYKQPSGEELVVVGWSDDTAVAATSGDESAFAVSTDDGYAFNDTGLIDTAIAAYADVAPSADASRVYLTSYDGNDASVWIFENKTYTRVLSMRDVASGSECFLVRFAPEDDTVVYVSSTASDDMWRGTDSGMAKWKHVECYKLTAIQDFVVESEDVVYAIDTNSCSKSTNGGSTWADEVSLDGLAGYMITLTPNNDILVGGSDSHVAFSKDGGKSFVKILDEVDGGSNDVVHVVADPDYADNNIIYAASDDEICRGKADKGVTWASREPKDSVNILPSGFLPVGMAQHGDATYVLYSDGTDSRLYRSLDLQTGATDVLCRWSYLSTGYEFERTPRAMKMAPDTSDGPTFYAVDTNVDFMNAKDPLATIGPTPQAPADALEVTINPITGKAFDVTFVWERYSNKYVTECLLQIATDPDFNGKVYDGTFGGITKDTISQTVGPTGSTSTEPVTTEVIVETVTPGYTIVTTDNTGAVTSNQTVPEITTSALEEVTTWVTTYRQCEFMPLTTYYWRVRVSGTTYGPLISKWSETGSFTVAEAFVEPPVEVVIPPPAPPAEITVEVPDVVVQLPPAAPVEPVIPTYMLWLIIGIGAVLLIALVVLIVRTRRVV